MSCERRNRYVRIGNCTYIHTRMSGLVSSDLRLNPFPPSQKQYQSLMLQTIIFVPSHRGAQDSVSTTQNHRGRILLPKLVRCRRREPRFPDTILPHSNLIQHGHRCSPAQAPRASLSRMLRPRRRIYIFIFVSNCFSRM